MLMQGAARQGKAGHGGARHGKARLGTAWLGKARVSIILYVFWRILLCLVCYKVENFG
jgi:hypothetical protein